MAWNHDRTLNHGVYIGPVEELKGKTAALQKVEGGVAAQFDERFEYQGVNMGFGWHEFDYEDFEYGR